MAKVKGKIHLCNTLDFRGNFTNIQGFEGKDIFQRYNSLKNIIEKEVDEEFQHFLSEPVLSMDKADVEWHCVNYSDTPTNILALDSFESSTYLEIKERTLNHFNSVILSLEKNGKQSESDLLRDAIKFIDDKFIFCFDNKVVLGVWGMSLRKNATNYFGLVAKSHGVKNNIRFDLGDNAENRTEKVLKKTKGYVIQSTDIPDVKPLEGFTFLGWNQDPNNYAVLSDVTFVAQYEKIQAPITPISNHVVKFIIGEESSNAGVVELNKSAGDTISISDIPKVEVREGYEFVGWNNSPYDHEVNADTSFTAQFSEKKVVDPITRDQLPWYLRLWNWLKKLLFGKGCLRWLLWLLLLLLIIFLVMWLLRSCGNGDHTVSNPIPDPINDKPFVREDPRSGRGGIYNPGAPYTPDPTPPEYRDVLPPNEGVMPPIDTTKFVRNPGAPVVVGNRINILMENEDKSIMDLAKKFKEKYPDASYTVVYYDDVVKRMQIELPEQDRLKIKEEIPRVFAPEYTLFVFDEALFESSYAPNDPAFREGDKSWYLKTIKAEESWDLTTGNDKLTIAIVDNGFNTQHPEFKGKIVMPYNVWKHSNEVFAQVEDHGTHVAGTALALMDNSEGLCGIAPKCAFMPIQVANENDVMTTTSILDGVLYALYQGADVINISLGSVFDENMPENVQLDLQENHFKEEERLWSEIMKIADKHKATIVLAAGNDNMLAGLDAFHRPKNFIVVSALDKEGGLVNKAEFSNYGQYSTISAPGVDIFSSFGASGYEYMSGTSMAAPVVTGAVALLKSINKDLTSEEIICILQGTGLPVGGNIGNLIQLSEALKKVQSGQYENCKGRVQPETPSSGDVQFLLKWNNYNDLDLSCLDPQGHLIWYKNRLVPSGGLLEIDMNVNPSQSKEPIENIFWPTGSAPKGKYQVYIHCFQQHEQSIGATTYNLLVHYGNTTQNLTGEIRAEEGKKLIYTFDYK